ncbi:MAG: DNA repair protein RecO [Clostridia bacterium]|nr:DNA repair protein RecO [Clostridia bacterium]
MANLKLNGIVIAENNMGDYDKMLTILTPNYGKISCVAKGARRPQSALLAGTQLFCFGEYLVYKGTNTYHINSCETIEIFYNLRTDLDKLKYAIHINKIIQDVTEENENCYRILQLFLNTLYMISETDKDKDFILSVFKFRLLCILGFSPRTLKCTSCKQENVLTKFSIRDNGFKCEACARQDKSSIDMSESTKSAIKYTISAPPKKLFSFNLKDEGLEEFKLITKIYFNEKLEKEYKVEELF